MTRRNLHLFGAVRVESDDGTVPRFRSQRTMALLGYLVAEQRAVARDALAALFWPDETQARGRSNLRRELHNLSQILPDCWEANRQSVRFSPTTTTGVDLYQLAEYEAAGQWAKAAELVRGDFLEGLYLDDNLEFETWLLGERERWRQQAEDVLVRLVDLYTRQADYTAALKNARKLLQLTPWNEAIHRQVMLLLARTGQREAALKQYQRCQTILEAELGVVVSAGTTILYKRIKRNATFTLHNLPTSTTPFIGRESELSQLVKCLDDPQVRLVTITGPGGMGKTQLALAVARHVVQSISDQIIEQEPWPDGIYLVSLQAVPAVDGIVTAIADALGFRFSGKDTPQKQLVRYLESKQALLLLDNFEHLLAGSSLLTRICEACPDIHFLVTSRERLDLQQEHIFPLSGLAYPQALDSQVDTYPAVRLFEKTIQRVQPDFEIDMTNLPFVATICQRVEGMPLALELAASWAHVMSLHDIAQNLTNSLDLLSSTARDLPDRHRSMRAVFDMTWQLLTRAEQQSFANLSIFQGGFGREAALQVANTSMPQLAALINKSLVRYNADQNRYDLHELLRQYGREKLEGINDLAFEVADQHSTYYCAQLDVALDILRALSKSMAQSQFVIDYANICQAWEWALRHKKVKRLQNTIDSFGLLLMRMARYHEGKVRFEQALKQWTAYEPESLDQAAYDYVYAQLLIWGGEFFDFLGYKTQANTMLQQALEILTDPNLADTNTQSVQAAALLCLGDTAQGVEAQRYYQHALDLAKANDDRWLEASGLRALSDLYLQENLRPIEETMVLAEQALKVYHKIDDPLGIASTLQLLAEIALSRGDTILAKKLINESRQTYQQINLDSGIARCHSRDGNIAAVRGEFEEAIQYHRQAISIWEALNIPASAVQVQSRLAWALIHQGMYEAAHLEATRASQMFEGETVLNQTVDYAYYVLGLHALVQGENSQGQRYFQMSLEQTTWPRNRGYSLCGLALVEYQLKSTANARHYLNEALDKAQQTEVYLLVLHALDIAALLLADAGAIEFACELHDQMIAHPFNVNSRWVADVIYRPLAQIFQVSELDKSRVVQADQTKQQWCAQTWEACQKLLMLLSAR